MPDPPNTLYYGDNLDVLRPPDFTLELFDRMIFVFCFDWSNLDSHRVSIKAMTFSVFGNPFSY